ncbi:MlaE family lipid ABC transporter permease subunit [Salidesulfovibrio brasiliensis]
MVVLSGRLDGGTVGGLWDRAADAVAGARSAVTLDCARVDYLDGSGAAMLVMMRDRAARSGGSVSIRGLSDELQRILEMTWACEEPKWTVEKERRGFAEMVGRKTEAAYNDLVDSVAFAGEIVANLAQSVRHPGRLRWKDILLACVRVGVDSLPIIFLIGFLMGLILSFQSAVTLQRFGGEIFVPNMLGLVMFREMGPLVTCILLAARSGSAFAAEIGTMKVNEEVDALNTMGLSPTRFLVTPKILASILMAPLMTMFFNFAALVGGLIVMISLGYPLVTYTSRVFQNLQYTDFYGGLIKALVFSILVAGIGCLRGLQTRSGASAVGDSTTSAVVSGIILIAFADGIFAVAYYYLGI